MQQRFDFFSNHPWYSAFSCLLAGAAMPLAFAPLSLFPLGFFLPAWLFLAWARVTPGRAFVYGWSFGLGMFVHGVYWVYHSMHVFGHMPLPLAMLFTVLLAAYFALFPAVVGWAVNRWLPFSLVPRVVLAYPVVWVLAEWVRGWLFTGFPWLNLGYSQTDTVLAGYAPLVGVYGVSWLVALTAGLCVWLLVAAGSTRLRPIGIMAALWLCGWLAGQLQWTQVEGGPLRVSLVQGNIAQATKWHPARQQEIIASYVQQTSRHWDSDLIIWPETAVPAFYRSVDASMLRELEHTALQTRTDLLLGLPVLADNREDYYNSMVSVGSERAFYFKRHLVPFGEFIPLKSWLKDMLDILKVPMASFLSGDRAQPPLSLAGYRAAISICYEIAFGEEVITMLPQAHFLVNVSNNAWFGDSSAPHQQLQMARMRAQETGRDVVSATNDGVTAIVDHRGVIVDQAPQFQAHVLTGTITPRSGATPYVRFGNYAVVIVLMLVLAVMVYQARRTKLLATSC